MPAVYKRDILQMAIALMILF